jgi:hypothetical protein
MKRTILILLAFNLGLGIALSDPKLGETRTATLTYKVSSNDVINLQAKYTDVNIESWNKSEVSIEAIIRFDGKMTDKMQKFLDSFEEEVEVNISEKTGELKINTNLDEPNKFQIGSKNVGIIISFNEDELKLAYNLKVPESNKLIIKNSYRDLNLVGNFDDVEIDQYSGDLEAETINEADIKLKYGSAQFNEIRIAKMELYEQDITANSIGELEIDTKYSELKVKDLGRTEIVSYESDFEISNLSYLEGNLKYGKMEVTEVFDEGKLTTYEFDIEAKEIGTLTLENGKYGKTEAGSITQLNLRQSYEDDFEIEALGTLIVDESKYVSYEIGRLTGKLEISNGYEGKVDIDGMGNNVSSIKIAGKYIETSINTEGISYKLITDTKYGDVKIDRSTMNISKYIKEGDQLEIEATSNSGKTANPVLISIKGYEMDIELD